MSHVNGSSAAVWTLLTDVFLGLLEIAGRGARWLFNSCRFFSLKACYTRISLAMCSGLFICRDPAICLYFLISYYLVVFGMVLGIYLWAVEFSHQPVTARRLLRLDSCSAIRLHHFSVFLFCCWCVSIWPRVKLSYRHTHTERKGWQRTGSVVCFGWFRHLRDFNLIKPQVFLTKFKQFWLFYMRHLCNFGWTNVCII